MSWKEKVRTEPTVDKWVFIELEGKGRGIPTKPYHEIPYSKNRHRRNKREVGFYQTLTGAQTHSRAAGNKIGYWRRESREKAAGYPGP